MKALFTYNYGNGKMKSLQDLGYEIIIIKENEISNENIPDDIEILTCYNPFGKINVEKLKKLKWIQLSSTGFDQLPIEEIRDKGIIVTNNKGGYSKPIGEWIVMSILNIYKDSKYFFRKQDEKTWKINTNLMELVNKNILFLGTGTLAVEGAKRLQGFESNIVGMNSNGRDIEFFDRCIAKVKLKEEIEKFDIVISTLPYSNETHHLVDEEILSLMKEESIFINVSRGNVLDEKALEYYLEKGKFLGVALDVFESEPLKESSKLWNYERVYISPHNSWVSEMRNERRFFSIYKNMKNYIEGKKLNNLVEIN